MKTKLNQNKPLIMGIVNVTPDSFSDGGHYLDPKNALDRITQLIQDGADIIDIGAESTRPGAITISDEDEIERLTPIISTYKTHFDTPLSIDTSKATVAKWALSHGADIINDISGLEDPKMPNVIADANATVVIMHIQGTPQTMQENPQYDHIIDELQAFFNDRIQRAQNAGVQNIILDPGIGFGKTLEHNLSILKHLHRFTVLGHPLLIGTSNKSFIGHITAQDVQNRLEGSIASALLALQNGAKICRVHNVVAMKQALSVANAIWSAT